MYPVHRQKEGRSEVRPERFAIEISEMKRIPRRTHLMAGERIPRCISFCNQCTVQFFMAILCDVDIVRRSGCPYGHKDERSSCSQAVVRRGVASGSIPFSAKKPPPLTMVASTFSYSRQRSMPPWASRILLSSWFIIPPLSSSSSGPCSDLAEMREVRE